MLVRWARHKVPNQAVFSIPLSLPPPPLLSTNGSHTWTATGWSSPHVSADSAEHFRYLHHDTKLSVHWNIHNTLCCYVSKGTEGRAGEQEGGPRMADGCCADCWQFRPSRMLIVASSMYDEVDISILLLLLLLLLFKYQYTGCFTTLGHNCRRWFPRFLWSKKFI